MTRKRGEFVLVTKTRNLLTHPVQRIQSNCISARRHLLEIARSIRNATGATTTTQTTALIGTKIWQSCEYASASNASLATCRSIEAAYGRGGRRSDREGTLALTPKDL